VEETIVAFPSESPIEYVHRVGGGVRGREEEVVEEEKEGRWW
jgi:hypothetical protein